MGLTFKKTGNTLILLVGLLVLVVLVNLIFTRVHLRWDLTENRINSLSPYCIKLAKDLLDRTGDLEIRIYVSESLPEVEKGPDGSVRRITGVRTRVEDLLDELRARVGDELEVGVTSKDLDTQAQELGLRPFVGEKAELVESGEGILEMKAYYLGISISSGGVREVIPKALDPGVLEYELARALLTISDVLSQRDLQKTLLAEVDLLLADVKRCEEELAGFDLGDKAAGLSGLAAEMEIADDQDLARALSANRDLIGKRCSGLGERAETLRQTSAAPGSGLELLLAGPMAGDPQTRGGVGGYALLADRLLSQLEQDKPDGAEVVALRDGMKKLMQNLGTYRETLDQTLGRRRVGFLCGAKGLCPIPEARPIFDPGFLEAQTRKFPQFQGMFDRYAKLEASQRNRMMRFREQYLRGRDYDLVRVEKGAEVPKELAALVIFGPRAEFSEEDLYHLDQYLLSGGSVVVFLAPYQVDIGTFSLPRFLRQGSAPEQPDNYGVQKNSTNISELLAAWGVAVGEGLVADPVHRGRITLTRISQEGEGPAGERRAFDYPLFIYSPELDRELPMVRGLAATLLTWASPLNWQPRGDWDGEVREVVRTSGDAVFFSRPDQLPLFPPEEGGLGQLSLMPDRVHDSLALAQARGPFVLALAASGTFSSFFRDKPLPQGVSSSGFLPVGKGRLLVAGSDLGLEIADPEWTFQDFNPEDLTPGPLWLLPTLREKNWQLRFLQVVDHLLPQGMPLLYAALDWGVQRQELAEIRTRQAWIRPLNAISSEGARTGIQIFFIAGLPLVFLVLALVFRYVRARVAAGRTRASGGSSGAG